MNILSIEQVTKRYTNHTALDEVSFQVPAGSIYGLLGPNGAGKTTLIRIINGITAPDSGQVLLAGKPISSGDNTRIGYLPEERGLYRKMRVGEQALYFAMLRGMDKREATRRLKEWFERFEIYGWWNRKVEQLSKGMAQKVQFIVTVLHEPELLILDEPFSGFDPVNAEIIRAEILRLRYLGATVIFSTHNMNSVEQMCDHITLINRSRNILSGEVSTIRNRYGENIYRIVYAGEAEISSLVPERWKVLETGTEGNGLRNLTVRLNGAGDITELLSLVNGKVLIRSVNEIIPGMNDIFIKAVAGEL